MKKTIFLTFFMLCTAFSLVYGQTVTINVTAAGTVGTALSSQTPSSIKHLRITGSVAMNYADCRAIVTQCTNLETLDFGAYEQDIPDASGGVGAFEGLPVKRIKFCQRNPGQTIGTYAFRNCTNLVFARLDFVTVKDGVFEGCTAMTGAAFHRDKDASLIAGTNPFPDGIKVFVSTNAGRYSGFQAKLTTQTVINGTMAKPYVVATADEFDAIRMYAWQGTVYYELANNIDLGDFITNSPDLEIRTYGWEPVGDWNNHWEGVFDGKGYVVSNLWMTRSEKDRDSKVSIVELKGNDGYPSSKSYDQKGLFGANRGGALTIKNLGVTTASGKSVRAGSSVGGIIGLSNTLSMENCYFIGTVESEGSAGNINNAGSTGGLVGKVASNSSSITKSFAIVTINGKKEPGGIIGEVDSPNFLLQNCYVTGSVSGVDNVAGLIGKTNASVAPKVEKCYVTATITDATNGAGGLFGNTTGNNAIAIDNFILSDQIKRGTGGTNSPIYAWNNFNTTASSNNKAYDGIAYNGGTIDKTTVTEKTKAQIVTWSEPSGTYTDEFKLSTWDLENIWYRVNGENYALPVLRSLPLAVQPQVTPSWLTGVTLKDAEITITEDGSGTVSTTATGSGGNYTANQGETIIFTLTPDMGESILSFTINGVSKLAEVDGVTGEYQLLSAFGKIAVDVVFSGIANPDELVSVSIAPSSTSTYILEPVQFTATALNKLSLPAADVTYLWSCTPSTAGSFQNGTSATATFIPVTGGSITIECEVTQNEGLLNEVVKEADYLLNQTLVYSFDIEIATQVLYNSLYVVSEEIPVSVKVNGADVTRATFLNTLDLYDDMTVGVGGLIYKPLSAGAKPVKVEYGNATVGIKSATKNLTVIENNLIAKSGMSVIDFSSQDGGNIASNILVDGTGNRWAATGWGNEHVTVDLGAVYDLKMIHITWETATASTYEIHTGMTSSGLTKLTEQTGIGRGPLSTRVDCSAGTARYIKILCVSRATEHTYSFYSINVYGTPTNFTWTGANTVWANVANWTPAAVPASKNNVLIPAGKANYPVLAANTTVNNLTMEYGASLDLNGKALTANIIAEVNMTPRVVGPPAVEKWHSLGFPFNATAYCYALSDDPMNPSGASNPNYYLRALSGSGVWSDASGITAGNGYIAQLPSKYVSAQKISFVGAVSSYTEESTPELDFSNDTYKLQANPAGFLPFEITLGAKETVYRLSPETLEYLPVSGGFINPFEAVVTYKQGTMAPAPKISLDVDAITGLLPAINEDAVIDTRFYNIQGLEVAQPQKGSVYIVKSIRESGKTEVTKQIK